MRTGNKGITLVELMAAGVILIIIMVPVSLLFYSVYKNYFMENDMMVLQQRTREAMDQIVEDLRANENKNTTAGGNTLSIDQNHEYTYVNHELRKNGDLLFSPDEGIEVTGFLAQNKSGEYDSGIISISLTLKSRRGGQVTVENNYRRKLQ